MHTSCYESCRIHHNGDYSGDIVITNKDSTSNSIGKKATISYSPQALIDNFKIHQKKYPDGLPKDKTVIIEGNQESGPDPEIEILVSDIESFLEDLMTDKITEKLENNALSVSDLEKIVDILKIELSDK